MEGIEQNPRISKESKNEKKDKARQPRRVSEVAGYYYTPSNETLAWPWCGGWTTSACPEIKFFFVIYKVAMQFSALLEHYYGFISWP